MFELPVADRWRCRDREHYRRDLASTVLLELLTWAPYMCWAAYSSSMTECKLSGARRRPGHIHT